MKYVLITLPPLLLFLAVVVAGEWLLREEPRPTTWTTESTQPSPPVFTPAPVPQSLIPQVPDDPRVPSQLAAPLRAVAVELNLCVSQAMQRDLGPIDIDVRFTPTPSGAFAPGTKVTTSWDDPNVADCIAEVFDEAAWMPTNAVRAEPAEFVFHLPDGGAVG